MILSFAVPGLPRGWARARLAKGGAHHFTDAKTAAFKDSVAFWCLQAMKREGVAGLVLGPVELSIRVFLPIPASLSAKKRKALAGMPCPRKPDIDNLNKIIMDALNGVLYRDDVQVTGISAQKTYRDDPCTTVTARFEISAEDLI